MSTLDKIILNGTEYDLSGSGEGGGITPVAQALLINILRNGVYKTDQSTNITNLETELASGGGGATTVAIINTLTNCTSNNSASSISVGSSYMATITANTGYDITSATVTMGGVDVTTTVYSAGVITIPNVTGTLVITVTAESEAETGLVHYWDLTSGSLVDTIDGETTLTLGGSASISSGTGVYISDTTDFVRFPFTNGTHYKAKIIFGTVNYVGTSGNKYTLIGGKSAPNDTAANVLRYWSTQDKWIDGNDVSSGLSGSSVFENKEIMVIKNSNDQRKLSVLYNDETVINEFSPGYVINYLQVGGGFKAIYVKSIKVYTE